MRDEKIIKLLIDDSRIRSSLYENLMGVGYYPWIFGGIQSGGGLTRWVKWRGYTLEDADGGDVSSPPEGKVARSIGSTRCARVTNARDLSGSDRPSCGTLLLSISICLSGPNTQRIRRKIPSHISTYLAISRARRGTILAVARIRFDRYRSGDC